MHTANRPGLMRNRATVLTVAIYAAVAFSATVAHAAIAISSQSTQNMSCSNGVCAPTAQTAVLNTGDLETLLASGNVTVTTTGAGVEADNINVRSALSWATANTLSLAAHRTVAIDAPISAVGQSGLTIQTNGKKGTLSFGSKGRVGFSNLSSQLAINGIAYTLAGNIKTLVSDIAANPGGAYALAGTYDASADGTYTSSPIGAIFTGTFEGLGNTILNLSVSGGTYINGLLCEGLFAELGAQGMLENIRLTNATISGGGNKNRVLAIGTLVGNNNGWIGFSHVSGTILAKKASRYTEIGGLAADNSGTIASSSAATSVDGVGAVGGFVGDSSGTINDSSASGEVIGEGPDGQTIGGLVYQNSGTISSSFATGAVLAKGRMALAGGLAGTSGQGTIVNSYATGSVTGSRRQYPPNVANLGGLVGANGSTVSYSYSTGAITGATVDDIGGLIGKDYAQAGDLIDTDWDTSTSGITNLSQGAGSPANDPGITGLTTAQLQSGLPPGFDPKIWGENPNINGSLPYLVANPPPK